MDKATVLKNLITAKMLMQETHGLADWLNLDTKAIQQAMEKIEEARVVIKGEKQYANS